jgi:hypothetical protein
MVTCGCKTQGHTAEPVLNLDGMQKRQVYVPDEQPELSTMTKCTVPVPKFLRHLPTDKRGFPVPYVSEWHDESGEANMRRVADGTQVGGRFEKARIAGSPWPVTLLSPSGTKGKGAPRLASLHPIRQRECVLKRKCQVCGRSIKPSSTCLLVGGERHEVDGKTLFGFREPPLHPRCAVFALYACPGINRAEVVVSEQRDYDIVPYSQRITQHYKDGSVDTEPVIGFVPYDQGYVEYLLAVPRADALVHLDPATFRASRLHLLH